MMHHTIKTTAQCTKSQYYSYGERQENFAEMIATQMTDCTKTSKVVRNSTF